VREPDQSEVVRKVLDTEINDGEALLQRFNQE
jgi:hypothetical protein